MSYDFQWKENGKIKLLIIVGTRPEIIRSGGDHSALPGVFRLLCGPYRAELRQESERCVLV